MKDYYKILNIDKAADAAQIKRAYFVIVKKYPPERFPEEFKEIRSAYETLSDKEKREIYDREYNIASVLPEEVNVCLSDIRRLIEQGMSESAMNELFILTERFPAHTILKAELASMYTENGKSGKAVSLWEEICKIEPDNTEYMLKLAMAYNERGWRKKAIEQYNSLLKKNDENIKAWIGLAECYKGTVKEREILQVSTMAEKAVKKEETDTLMLYCTLSLVNLGFDNGLAERYLHKIEEIIRDYPNIAADKGEEAVSLLLNAVMTPINITKLQSVLKIAGLLPNVGNDVSEIIERATFVAEIKVIEQKGMSELITNLFARLLNGCDCEHCKSEIATLEIGILMDFSIYKPQIITLKKEHPMLYNLHSEFFNDTLRTNNIKKLMHQKIKRSQKQRRTSDLMSDFFNFLDFDGFEQSSQPVQREEAKIGRNAPCPCGSGKKYKRCCGA